MREYKMKKQISKKEIENLLKDLEKPEIRKAYNQVWQKEIEKEKKKGKQGEFSAMFMKAIKF